MNPEDASQPQFAVAVVDRCGGRISPIPWEKVAVSIWRAFPDRASLRTGLLLDTYSIQTWVWDAKTKLGFLDGGNREGGWRITADGARWLDQNPAIIEYVRNLLLDESTYVAVPTSELVLACLSPVRATARSGLVVEAFRRFPASFGLKPTQVWPDAAAIDEAASAAESAGWLTLKGADLTLTDLGASRLREVEQTIDSKREVVQARRRSLAGQYATRVENTRAYGIYLDTGDMDAGADVELYQLIQCPPNAGLPLIEASLAEVLDNLTRADRPDLRKFVQRWAQRSLPESIGIRLTEGNRYE
jgi:hypothetical protein